MPSGGKSSRDKGARYERAGVGYLKQRLNKPHLERRIAGMGDDKGDVAGWPRVVVEFKDHATLTPSAWVAQLESEMLSARAITGVVIAKRKGYVNVADHYAIMPVWLWADLIVAAGY